MSSISTMMNPALADKFFIGGEWVAASSDRQINVVTPSTEEVLGTFSEAQATDMDRAVAAAREAFDHGPWPRMSVAARGAYLRAIGTYLESRHAALATAWTSQIGVLHRFSSQMIHHGIANFGAYADLGEEFAFVERHPNQVGAKLGLLASEPVGVVAAIIPWNSALSTATVKVAPALIAGCTVILKPAPETPIEAYIIAEAAQAVGLPKGVLNVLNAGRDVSEALVRHKDVDKVTFTGSGAAGKRIASLCGERVARCTLELGGKSAAVVLDDYDVEEVAKAITQSSCILSNQVCAALSRVIVPRHRHDALVEAFRESFGRIRVGDPYDEQAEMGPLATATQLERVRGYIAIGEAEGAERKVGGGRPAGMNRGFYIEPTVFANVDNRSTIAQEEIFGPVVCIIPADSEDQAVEIANDTIFGLNGAVFTNDADRAYGIARLLRTGTVGHNGFKVDFSIGFGGFKQSGLGREGGRAGLLAFLESKTILLDGTPARLDEGAATVAGVSG